MNHGQTGASTHDHIFFGSLDKAQFGNGLGTPAGTLDQSATNLWLRQQPLDKTTECKEPDQEYKDYGTVNQQLVSTTDKGLYWAPALYHNQPDRQNNVIAKPAYALAYWRNENVNPHDSTDPLDPGNMHPMPANLTEVGGDMMATTPQPVRRVEWSCVLGNYITNNSTRSADGKVAPVIPDPCPGHSANYPGATPFLRMIVRFPDCIPDSEIGNQQPFHNYADMDYAAPPAGPNKSGTVAAAGIESWVCPKQGEDPIPMLTFGVRWRLDDPADPWAISGTGTGIRYKTNNALLATDPSSVLANNTRGMTGHADYMNGYGTADTTNLMRDCYYALGHDSRDHINCGVA